MLKNISKNTNKLFSSFSPTLLEAGVDEVGRGCLAGPVVAAAVILPKNFTHNLLNDSKKITENNRNKLKTEIEQHALSFAIAEVSNSEIDKINILNATFLAMHKALELLKIRPELILVDGNRFAPYQFIPHKCIIKGDSTYFSIAAASVLAKCYRDTLMKKYAKQHPYYGWEKNVGYPTLLHRLGIENHGTTALHRNSFRLLKSQEKK